MDVQTAMNPIQSNKFLSTQKVLSGQFSGEQSDAPGSVVSGIAISAIEKIIGIEKFNNIMMELGPPWPDADQIIDYLFKELNIRWTIENPSALEELDDGPKVFVANHPYGLPDALGMFRMLTRHRPHLKLFANTILAATQLDDDRLLFVDPFMTKNNRGLNRKSVATALRHLRAGGDLALFPGRICSHLKTSDWTISDSEWTDQVHRFVEISGGEMVPFLLGGKVDFVLAGHGGCPRDPQHVAGSARERSRPIRQRGGLGAYSHGSTHWCCLGRPRGLFERTWNQDRPVLNRGSGRWTTRWTGGWPTTVVGIP